MRTLTLRSRRAALLASVCLGCLSRLPGNTVPTDLAFATSDQSMWGPGTGSSLDKTWSNFLFNFSGGGNIDKLGLHLPYAYSGRVGLEPRLQISTGTVDVGYPIRVNATLPDTVATSGSFSINTANWVHQTSSLETTGPGAHFTLDAVLKFDATAGPGDLSPAGLNLLNIPKYTFGVDKRYNLVDVGSGSSSYELPAGPYGSLTVAAPEILSLSSSTLILPELAKLKAEGRADTPFLNLSLDLDAMAVSAFGLPPQLLGGSYHLGTDFSIEYELLNLNANLGLQFAQSFTFQPTGIAIKMTSDSGQVRTGKLGDTFTFTAPDEEGTFGVAAEFSLTGNLKSQTGFIVNGSLVVEAGKFVVHNTYGPDFDYNFTQMLGLQGDYLYSKTLPEGGFDIGSPIYLFDQTFGLGGFEKQFGQYEIEVVDNGNGTPDPLGLWPLAVTLSVTVLISSRLRSRPRLAGVR